MKALVCLLSWLAVLASIVLRDPWLFAVGALNLVLDRLDDR